jgi:hypothetical protein
VGELMIPAAGEGKELQELMTLFDAPAYVRRARRVEEALEQLLARCARQRHEWLEMVRLQVGQLREMAGGWAGLRPHLADDAQLRLLRDLHDAVAPALRLPVPPASPRAVRRALRELVESIERFNRRWVHYLSGIDVGPVNAVREGYNRFFVLEKECALRSPPVARRGFRPLPPLTPGEVASQLPPLAVPRLARPLSRQ